MVAIVAGACTTRGTFRRPPIPCPPPPTQGVYAGQAMSPKSLNSPRLLQPSWPFWTLVQNAPWRSRCLGEMGDMLHFVL